MPTPEGAWATNLRFLRTVASVLGHLYLRRRSARRPAATDEDREVFELLVDRSRSLTTSDPKRFLVDSLEYVRKLNQVDPKSVERPGGSYAGAIGIFSFGGLSFAVGRRFLDLAREVVDEDDPRDLVTFRMMSFFHHFLVGDWSDEHELSPRSWRTACVPACCGTW